MKDSYHLFHQILKRNILEFDMDTKKIVNFIDVPMDKLKLRVNSLINSKNFDKLKNEERVALEIFNKKAF